ncbi:MAG TPA: methyltransferase domain-containing protein [Candidatus Binatia bacterium]|nr:methyltransferase domain-containing protein [Candidatus Binatia bacterium]
MKRSSELEMMDLPGQPRELLIEDLRNLRTINRYLGCHRAVLRGLACALNGQSAGGFTLLDVGTGNADVPAAIVDWARRQKLTAQISCLDREAITIEQAAEQTRHFPEITVARGDALTPPFRPASFDFVLASQLLHHYSNEQIVALLRSWAKLARRAIIVSDLVRHPLAYHGIRLLTKSFTRNIMTRTDAPLSVQRALTIEEWRAVFRQANIGRFSVDWALPFRMRGLIWLEN